MRCVFDRSLAALAWALAVLTAAPPAHANGLQVSPVRLELSAERPHAVLTVSNPSNAPMLIEASAFVWQPGDADDRSTPAPGVLLNPPIFELPPGARQLVRVGLKPGTALAPDRESGWRVWLAQVPDAAGAAGATAGVRMLFRVNLPLLIAPRGAAPARALWGRTPDALTLANTGRRVLQVHGLSARRADGAALALPMQSVLPETSVRWPLPDDWRAATLDVRGTSNVGVVRHTLPPLR